MKILVVTQYFWPENFKINDLCEALVEKGHDVTVYTGLPNYSFGKFFKGYSLKGPYTESLGKIKIIRVPLIPRGNNKNFQLLLNYISFFLIALLLAPFRVKGKFDRLIVLGASPVTPIIPGIFLKLIKKTSLFFWIMDLWPDSLEATGVITNKRLLSIIETFIGFSYKFCDRILVTSKGFIPRIKSLGVNDYKILYLPQWAEKQLTRQIDPFFDDARIPRDGFKIMFAGNIGSSQDFETLVEAAKILKSHKDIFILVLGDGLMKQWAEDEVRRFSLEENFIFLGRKPLESMVDYYAKADVMLMSLTDTKLFAITVPAKLQGYLACGKPILASINGEGAELVKEARAGVSIPAGNPHLLAETILNLSKLPKEELLAMGENGRKFYKNNFDREVLMSFLDQKLNEV